MNEKAKEILQTISKEAPNILKVLNCLDGASNNLSFHIVLDTCDENIALHFNGVTKKLSLTSEPK